MEPEKIKVTKIIEYYGYPDWIEQTLKNSLVNNETVEFSTGNSVGSRILIETDQWNKDNIYNNMNRGRLEKNITKILTKKI